MAFVLPALSGCAVTKDPAQLELDTNRSIWEKAGIVDYEFQLRIVCFCPYDYTRPVTVQVAGGNPVTVTYADAPFEVTTDFFQRADTIEKLFDIIQNSIDTGADSLVVKYDPTYGYPKSISIDPIKDAIDEEISYLVKYLIPKP
ncbi:hypothetical protein DGWBC_0456 [Dehalogenimonas sp. WBC-2]|nr:hypothetical protein DGWBC_0456 [Dehalogenimonas sp. WBC-2]